MVSKYLVTTFLVAAAAAAQQTPPPAQPITEAPGYVDLDVRSLFGEGTSTVEIYLEGPLLKVMAGAMRESDAGLADLISSLQLVRVNVIPLQSDKAPAVNDAFKAAVENLEGNQWSRAVSVREQGSNMDMLMRMSDDEKFVGLAVFVAEGSEAVFINIVGDISPEDLGALAAKFMGDEFDGSFLEHLGEADAEDVDVDVDVDVDEDVETDADVDVDDAADDESEEP